MVDQGTGDPIYALGYSEEEFQQLMVQGRLFAEFTGHLFTGAGIGPGMRVLDVGCGVGDVSLLASDLVGCSGAVVGIDINERSLEIARGRATALGRNHIIFQQRDLNDLAFDEPFDAAVGRFVLMYAADPAEALRQVAAQVRPGGIVAFQKENFEYAPLAGVCAPLLDQTRRWVTETFRRARVETRMGGKLQNTFVGAGLPVPHMHNDQLVFNSTNAAFACEWAAEGARSLLPLMERLGVATATEVEVDTLAERLRHEIVDNELAWPLFPVARAWARKHTEADGNT
jgi:SAM-dependent methyltransferase